MVRNEGMFAEKTYTELTKLLYRQVDFALWAESLSAISVLVALWPAQNHVLLVSWFATNILFCGIARHILVNRFFAHCRKNILTYESAKFWVALFSVGVLVSGISWGIAGSWLMVDGDIIRQTFMVFLLVGVTAVANPFYSPFTLVYALFLFPAFAPFAGYLILLGGIFNILAVLAFIYIGVMLATSVYTQNLLASSLKVGFENIDLLNNLANTISTLKKRSHELEQSCSTLKATLESNTDGIITVNDKGMIINFNKKFLDMWELNDINLCEQLEEKNILREVSHQIIDPLHFVAKTEEMAANPEAVSVDEIYFNDGRIVERCSNPQYLANKCVGRVISFRDVTNRKLLEDKLYRQAHYDVLTSLPNRALVMDKLIQAISYAKRYSTCPCIMFLDLDRFKLINDTLGHTNGDKLLKEIALRLKKCINENDTVSREGGDEFLIILNAPHSEEEIAQIAHRCREEVLKDFYIGDVKINTGLSIGISVYPKDGEDAEMLIRNADIAMYKAKEVGGNNFVFYTDEMNRLVQRRATLENQLRNAIDNQELNILYQPIINLNSNTVSSVEALLRWSNNKLGLISPSEFIPIAEDSDQIISIGEWILEKSCQEVKAWQDQIKIDVGLNVNVSLRQLKQHDFLDNVKWILQRTGFKPHLLSIEITETVAMQEIKDIISILKELKNFGISLVVDDFGIGYSSLNYLKQLPVDKLKIDQSFVRGIPEHSDDAAITSSIIAMAKQLDLTVIAEGVMNEDQLIFLKNLKCQEVQGFYFSEPMQFKACQYYLQDKGKEVLEESLYRE